MTLKDIVLDENDMEEGELPASPNAPLSDTEAISSEDLTENNISSNALECQREKHRTEDLSVLSLNKLLTLVFEVLKNVLIALCARLNSFA